MNYETALEKIREIVKKHINLFSPQAYDISILPGWIELVDELLVKIQNEIAGTNGRIRIVQIKEKFGQLRVYYGGDGVSEEALAKIRSHVNEAFSKSQSSCVICGDPGERMSEGYITIRCGEHQDLEQGVFDNYNFTAFVKHEDELAKILRQS